MPPIPDNSGSCDLGYWTVSVTAPELVTWCDCEEEEVELDPPPQPVTAPATIKISAKQAINAIPSTLHFRLIATRGNSRSGKSTNAELAPGSVSAKTTVI